MIRSLPPEEKDTVNILLYLGMDFGYQLCEDAKKQSLDLFNGRTDIFTLHTQYAKHFARDNWAVRGSNICKLFQKNLDRLVVILRSYFPKVHTYILADPSHSLNYKINLAQASTSNAWASNHPGVDGDMVSMAVILTVSKNLMMKEFKRIQIKR